jgi:hypothetical protein
MKIAPKERLRVKVECLRLLATLRLNPAKMQLISGFIDTYLRLNVAEQQVFQAEIAKIEPEAMRWLCKLSLVGWRKGSNKDSSRDSGKDNGMGN